MTANALPGFTVTANGFPFANSWEPGTPVMSIPTPFGPIRLGDASGGVCGGMVFAAADYYLAGKTLPPDRGPAIFQYFCKRLVESWAMPFGLLRYYDLQRRPGATTPWVRGLNHVSVTDEWPKIKAAIDAGLPAPLGIVKVHSWWPQDMPRNHQILAYGYTFDKNVIRIDCYDPNWPGQVSSLSLDAQQPEKETPIEHSVEGVTVRGIFLTAYERPLDFDRLPAAG